MKKPHLKKVTDRFLEAMYLIIIEHKMTGGDIDSVKAFALSIDQLPQNFNKLANHGQYVSMEIITTAAEKYRINPTWIHLGEGDMFLQSESVDDIASLSRQLRSIAAKLEQHKETKLRRVK